MDKCFTGEKDDSLPKRKTDPKEELFNMLWRAGEPGGARPQHIAIHIRKLLDKGTSADLSDERGTRMLHLAAEKGLIEVRRHFNINFYQ